MKQITTIQNSGEMNIVWEGNEHGAYYHHKGFRRDERYEGPWSVMNTEQDLGKMNIKQDLGKMNIKQDLRKMNIKQDLRKMNIKQDLGKMNIKQDLKHTELEEKTKLSVKIKHVQD